MKSETTWAVAGSGEPYSTLAIKVVHVTCFFDAPRGSPSSIVFESDAHSPTVSYREYKVSSVMTK